MDGANLLGAFDAGEAADVLLSLCEGLKKQGYASQVYLEHRTWKYICCNQDGEKSRNAFLRACDDLGVCIVRKESDLAILQTLKVVKGAVAMTNDHYRDYARSFPSIVGSPRIRGFLVTQVGTEKLIAIDGLASAVPVTGHGKQEGAFPTAETGGCEDEAAEKLDGLGEGKRSFTSDMAGGLCGYANVLLEKGQVEAAIHCFKKVVARHESAGFAGLAAICDSRGDVKSAARFAKLRERLERRKREQAIRKRRIAAERRRKVSMCYAMCA